MNRHPIIAFVGPSGAGKTSMVIELKRRHPDATLFIRTLTSRPFRNAEDELFYISTPKEEILAMQTRGEIFQILEYAGNYYATRWDDLRTWLTQGVGLMALIEEAVDLYRSAFPMVIIKVRPTGAYSNRDATRAAADAKRDAIDVQPDLLIENAFDGEHPEQALKNTVDHIESFLKQKGIL